MIIATLVLTAVAFALFIVFVTTESLVALVAMFVVIAAAAALLVADLVVHTRGKRGGRR